MHRSNRLANVNITQVLMDICFLFLSYIFAYLTSSLLTFLYPISEYIWALIVYIPVWMLVMMSFRMYEKTTFYYRDRILRNVLLASFFAGLFVSALIFYTKSVKYSRILFSSFVVLTFILLVFERYIFQSAQKKFGKVISKNVILVGVPNLLDKFEYYLDKTNINMNIIGYVVLNSNKLSKPKNILGRLEDLDKIIKRNIVDEVVFALPKEYMDDIEKYVYLCEEMGITASVILNLYNVKIAKTYLTCVGTLPVLTYHSVCLNDFQIFIKRIIDIIGAIVGLLITAATSIFIIPAIKMDSPGPVFFAQNRVGLNGRTFKLYKFRTMYTDAEARKNELMAQNEMKGGLMFKIKNDPRVTKIGEFLRKTSLDELPQFYNVLRGEMSLVGTRPPTIDEVKKYKNHHRRRISIKPGITGLWQVSGRSTISEFDEVVKLDTQYIDEWSVLKDIEIIFKTFNTVARRKGAF